MTDTNSPDLTAFKQFIDYENHRDLYIFKQSNPINFYMNYARKGSSGDESEAMHEPKPGSATKDNSCHEITENILSQSVVIALQLADWEFANANDIWHFHGHKPECWTLGLLVSDDTGASQRLYIATSAHSVIEQQLRHPIIFLSKYKDKTLNDVIRYEEICRHGYRGYFGGENYRHKHAGHHIVYDQPTGAESPAIQQHVNQSVGRDGASGPESHRHSFVADGESILHASQEDMSHVSVEEECVSDCNETVNSSCKEASGPDCHESRNQDKFRSHSNKKTRSTKQKFIAPYFVDTLILPVESDFLLKSHVNIANLDDSGKLSDFQLFTDDQTNLVGKKVYIRGNRSGLRIGRISAVDVNRSFKGQHYKHRFVVVCDGQDGTDVGQFAQPGDSGAPVIGVDTVDGRHVVYGLVSGGKAAADAGGLHETYCSGYKEAASYYQDVYGMRIMCCNNHTSPCTTRQHTGNNPVEQATAGLSVCEVSSLSSK